MKPGVWHLDIATRDRLLSIGFPVLLLVLWEAAVRLNWVDARFSLPRRPWGLPSGVSLPTANSWAPSGSCLPGSVPETGWER